MAFGVEPRNSGVMTDYDDEQTDDRYADLVQEVE